MTHCLICFNPIYITVNWSNVIQIAKTKTLCTPCESAFQKMTGKTCDVCSRWSEKSLCYDCQHWRDYYNGSDPLQKNISIYVYNDAMKELISRWKYRGDYALGHVFQSVVKDYYTQYIKPIHQDMFVVPIPLSDERLMDRGFNQAQMLAEFITSQPTELLHRLFSEKQSKKRKKNE